MNIDKQRARVRKAEFVGSCLRDVKQPTPLLAVELETLSLIDRPYEWNLYQRRRLFSIPVRYATTQCYKKQEVDRNHRRATPEAHEMRP